MTNLASKAANALRPALTAAQGQWRVSALPRLLGWWLGQLLACLSPSMRTWLRGRDQLRRMRWDHDRPWQLGASGWEPLAPGAAGGEAGWVLLLGKGQVLVRTLAFPPGAAKDVQTAVTFEMDRYTPFKPYQVYHALSCGPLKAAQPLAVTLAVARRDHLDALLAQLAAHGIRPDSVDASGPAWAGLGLDLLTPERKAPRRQRQRQLNLTLLVLLLGLGCLSVVLWREDRIATLHAMQQEVARLRTAASEVEGLRQQLRNGLGAARYLAERKQASPALALMLSELSQCLPMDTWLSQLSVDPDGQVTLAGQSAHAGDLIEALNGCPSLTSPQFQGVIQPDETTGKERFYLLTRLNKKEPADAPPPDAP